MFSFKQILQFRNVVKTLKKHKEDIFNHIGTQVSYNDKTIILENNVFNINSFLQSENQALVVDGEAGAGKICTH